MSPGEIHRYTFSSPGCVLCSRRQFTPLGIRREKSCFPVHRGRGLRMAGWGTRPSQSGSCISRFITSPCTQHSAILDPRPAYERRVPVKERPCEREKNMTTPRPYQVYPMTEREKNMTYTKSLWGIPHEREKKKKNDVHPVPVRHERENPRQSPWEKLHERQPSWDRHCETCATREKSHNRQFSLKTNTIRRSPQERQTVWDTVHYRPHETAHDRPHETVYDRQTPWDTAHERPHETQPMTDPMR